MSVQATPRRKRVTKRKSRLSEHTLAKIGFSLEEGRSVREVAAEVGVSPSTVQRVKGTPVVAAALKRKRHAEDQRRYIARQKDALEAQRAALIAADSRMGRTSHDRARRSVAAEEGERTRNRIERTPSGGHRHVLRTDGPMKGRGLGIGFVDADGNFKPYRESAAAVGADGYGPLSWYDRKYADAALPTVKMLRTDGVVQVVDPIDVQHKMEKLGWGLIVEDDE